MVAEGLGVVGTGELVFNGYRASVGEDVMDAHVNVLNTHLKMVKMVNVILFIVDHNKKEIKNNKILKHVPISSHVCLFHYPENQYPAYE